LEKAVSLYPFKKKRGIDPCETSGIKEENSILFFASKHEKPDRPSQIGS